MEPFYHAISRISLTGSEITDESLHTLSLMPNLQKVFLNKTCITGEGLIFLQQLSDLQVLNLSHSDLDDNGLLYLLDIDSLEKVYLFQTFVRSEVLDALRWHRKDVEILEMEGPYY